MPEPDVSDYSNRDATSLKILGFFFTVLGTLVLVGTFWSLDNFRAVVVNLASGTVLTSIGLGLIYYVRRKLGRDKNPPPS